MIWFGCITPHWGEPKNTAALRSTRDTQMLRKDGTPITDNSFVSHSIARWYGISFRRRWFIGFWLFGETSERLTV